jgi:hypothetical protein
LDLFYCSSIFWLWFDWLVLPKERQLRKGRIVFERTKQYWNPWFKAS